MRTTLFTLATNSGFGEFDIAICGINGFDGECGGWGEALTLPNPNVLTPVRSSMRLRGGSDASSGASIFLALPVLAP